MWAPRPKLSDPGQYASTSGDARLSAARGSSLTHSILEYLGAAIVTEQFSPSNPLPSVAELCKQYGVCRSTVREAIKMRTAKGLFGSNFRARYLGSGWGQMVPL